jgi:hypothetical protein
MCLQVHVASSRTHHTDRFVCQRLLGGGQGAGLLTPVPPGAVVYGSGDSAVVLSKVRGFEPINRAVWATSSHLVDCCVRTGICGTHARTKHRRWFVCGKLCAPLHVLSQA